MSNTIELAKSFVPKLDECYRLASLTSVLDGAPELAKQGANANELIIPMMSMDGLADYSRNGGYVQGGVTMTNETVKCNFDRGRRFDVDVMDDLKPLALPLAVCRLSSSVTRLCPNWTPSALRPTVASAASRRRKRRLPMARPPLRR